MREPAGLPGEAFPARRTACAFVPGFCAAAHARADPALAGAAFAVAGRLEKRDLVSAASPQALAAGVKIGMTAAQALAACSALCLLPEQSDLEEQALAELTEALRSVSPAVEAAGNGLFHLDPRGLSRVHGDEATILERMVAVVSRLGFPDARAAVADTRFAACAAAACAESPTTLVPPGETRAFLAPLPLDLLPLSQENLERLRALGLKTLGEFAALPAASVEVRYGLEGVRAHRLARGLDSEPLARTPEIEEIAETFELEVRIDGLQQLAPILETLLDRVLPRLDGRGALGVEAAFLLDDGKTVEVLAEPAAPCADQKTLLTLLSLEIERTAFSAPVVEATVRVLAAAPRVAEQGSLFARRCVDPGRVQRVLARLRSLCGANALLHPSVRAAHRPEARTAPSATPGRGAAEPDPQPALPLSPALRLLDPPAPARVRLRQGRILSFALSGQPPLLVRLRFGPCCLSGEWWERPFARDYFAVVTAGHGWYWLYRDRATGSWYVHGVFD
ncbi:MAG: hypothetical protein HY812_10485 [Planctomycetes bacterium]|nr:hypothetical protein [Planctomycetota bacterium]